MLREAMLTSERVVADVAGSDDGAVEKEAAPGGSTLPAACERGAAPRAAASEDKTSGSPKPGVPLVGIKRVRGGGARRGSPERVGEGGSPEHVGEGELEGDSRAPTAS